MNYVFAGDVHQEDLNDVISSQREINRLRSDVQRLTTEMQHWRRLASDLQVPLLKHDDSSATSLVVSLSLCVQHGEATIGCQMSDSGSCI